jgi:hypothetical protein
MLDLAELVILNKSDRRARRMRCVMGASSGAATASDSSSAMKRRR